ncbi:hypothetical protein TNCV_3440361 [Trichonephila clavipes]|uniref:Uncharacterized protein n=1 Tax=Trichonephila clavipes TaxID=2585209 RepID=A0A8X7BFH3_TRICX|nr:hypothetical protein TNCV_3440361 [Trichonephila clavipes]
MSALSNEPVSANLGAVLQRNYDWEYASSDIVPRTNAVRLAHYNLQPRTPNAYRLIPCVRVHPTNLAFLCEMKIPCTKARNFRTTPSTASGKHFRPHNAI